MKGYRTIILAALQILAGLINEVTQAVTAMPTDANIALIVSGIIFAVMRVITSTPIGKQSE